MKLKLIISFLFSFSALCEEYYFLKQNSIPKFYETGQGKLGLCGQIYKELRKNLKHKNITMKVDEPLYPIKRILLKLDKGSGHVFCGAGKTPEREKKYIFSKKPIYTVNNVVVAHADEDFIPAKLEDFAKNRIMVGAYFGTSSSEFIKSISGIQVNDTFTNPDEAYKLIEAKKLRFFFYHDLALNYAVEHSKYKMKVVPVKFRSIEQWLIYSKKLPKNVREAIEAEVEEMYKNGQLQKIWQKFLVL
ncbi:transporter substrate-binding domain-containing protein [Bacteriovorax sp. Seq25_V]|uniref:transporter substrate-binding domain-containing protein n=1 Tax=Bacteriovorax sp. Seq25_V TaxID=1201288 RepID=UPI00038A124E|nr:transporter substrate-binding domain-containing protein [Bacteriovorax sp. Seq25_V]EQC46615.1 ABC transporter, substrate-binding protein, family 3 [Bacteriovorax sp. Seq25_V]